MQKVSPDDLLAAGYFRHLIGHDYDSTCEGCARAVRHFEKVIRRSRPASVGFSVSVWQPIAAEGGGWAVQWAQTVEYARARKTFESLAQIDLTIATDSVWEVLSESDKLQKREVCLFVDTVSHFGHMDRFLLETRHREVF